VPTTLFERLAARIANDHPDLPADMPARIVDQTLAFLGACATATQPLGPSDPVDIGWHTFILYTHDYATFCDRNADRFIHHQPDDEPSDEWPTIPKTGAALSTTIAAIRAAGFRLDPDLWSAPGADAISDCTQCHAGCTDSPTRR
jgi:hypothetical protein